MKTKILATAALMTLAAIGFANAADLPMPAPAYKAPPPPPPVYNWTGCYIAGGGGYGWWNQDSQVVATASRHAHFRPGHQRRQRLVRPGPRRLRLSIQYAAPQLEHADRHWRVRRLGRRQHQGPEQQPACGWK